MPRLRKHNSRVRAALGRTVHDIVHLFGPTVALLEELAEVYRKMPIADDGLPNKDPVRVIRGRLYGDGKKGPDGKLLKTPCDRPQEMRLLHKAGINGGNLCSKWIEKPNGRKRYEQCPLYYQCDYQARLRNNYDVELYLMAHEHMDIQLNEEKLPPANLMVVDENPLKVLLSLERIIKPPMIQDDAIGAIILAAFRAGEHPRAALIEAEWTAKAMVAHAQELEEKIKEPDITPRMNLKLIKKALTGYVNPILPRLIRRVAQELHVKHDGLRCLTYYTVKNDEGDVVERMSLLYAKNLRRVTKQMPVLALDGTGDVALLAQSFPGIVQRDVYGARNAVVYQVVGKSSSKTNLTSEDDTMRREVESIIERVAAQRQKVLVVTFKDAEADMTLPENCSSEHFFNLRGTVKYKDYDAIVLVGSPLVRVDVVERMAKALLWRSEQALNLPGAYVRKMIGFHVMDNLDPIGIENWVHPDPFVDKIRAQMCEAELMQAIDRLRLIFRNQTAQVVIVGHTVLPIPVDYFADYKANVPQRVGKKGRGGIGPDGRLRKVYDALGKVIPIQRYAWIADGFPELFTSENAVKMAVRDAREKAGGLYEAIGVRPENQFEFTYPAEHQSRGPGVMFAASYPVAVAFRKQWADEHGEDVPKTTYERDLEEKAEQKAENARKKREEKRQQRWQ
ncbi:MAG: hypothetical protein ABWZ57_02940 [Mesorhizobium sp.]